MGCRKRAAKSDLLRLVVVEGVIVPDPQSRMPGRGASLHLDPGCFALAERRRAFPRAFRLPGPLDVTMLGEFVRAHAEGGGPGEEQASNDDESRKAGSDCDERPMSTRR